MVCVGGCVCVGGGGLGREAAMKRMQMKVRIKFLKKTNLGWLKLCLATRVRTTGKKQIPTIGYFRLLKTTHKNPNLAK